MITNVTIGREEREQPNLNGAVFSSQAALYSPISDKFFAELITTDVTVQLDMPVPLYTVAGSF